MNNTEWSNTFQSRVLYPKLIFDSIFFFHLYEKSNDHGHDEIFGFVGHFIIFDGISPSLVFSNFDEKKTEKDAIDSRLSDAFHLRIVQRFFE